MALCSVNTHTLDIPGIENDTGELQVLPTEILCAIFLHCDIKALCRLSQVCKRFNTILKDECVWIQKGRQSLATNQLSEEIKQRSYHLIQSREKCRISSNWIQGRFKKKLYFRSKIKYMPWLILLKDKLWYSWGETIFGFKRTNDGLDLKDSSRVILHGLTRDVSKFVCANDMVISGGRDGSLCGWSAVTGELLFCHLRFHSSDINSVTCENDVIVSASDDKTVKILKSHPRTICELQYTIDAGDAVWSVKLKPDGKECAVGTTGNNEVVPLRLFDIQQQVFICCLTENYKKGAGILDIHWESPHTFLSTGYDTFIRLWDTRIGKNVSSWEDPYDCTVYCISSDSNFSVISGTCLHGRVQLWDKRARLSLQTYYMSTKHSSPVYSISFDPCFLFAAVDDSMNMLDFRNHHNPSVSYKSILQTVMRT